MKAEGTVERIQTMWTDSNQTKYRGEITVVGTKEEVEFFMEHAFSEYTDIHKSDKKSARPPSKAGRQQQNQRN